MFSNFAAFNWSFGSGKLLIFKLKAINY